MGRSTVAQRLEQEPELLLRLLLADVEAVLDALEAGPAHQQKTLELWNKMDRLDDEAAEDVALECDLANRKAGRVVKLPISAVSGAGIETMLDVMDRAIAARSETVDLVIAPQDGRAHAWLHQNGEVLTEEVDPETGSIHGRFRLSISDSGRFRAEFPHLLAPLPEAEPWEEADEE